MQTFLPFADYVETARVLDRKRLGNQVYRECLTLLRGGWPNHPASRMWRGHERHLALYGLALLDELERRPTRAHPEGKLYPHHRVELEAHRDRHPDTGPPAWLGDETFHAAHRSKLLSKNPEWYGRFGWSEPDDLSYVWPVPEAGVPLSLESGRRKRGRR